MGFLRAIPAFLYSLGLRVRHWLYDSKVLRSEKFDIPVLCVGNLTVGGTGKTPFTEYLVRRLSRKYNIAILSRGYGRRTKGYIEVQTTSSFLDVGDEPKQMKRKFPKTVMVVCEDRAEGIRRIREEHPEVNAIIMDDGFQHRRVEPKVNIVLMDYTRPLWSDHLLPWGNRRDLLSQLSRANIVIVTKTPEDMKPIDRRLVVKNLDLYPYQSIFFTAMNYGDIEPVFPDAAIPPGKNVAVMAGIGNPAILVNRMKEEYVVQAIWLFRDHHVYKVRELKKIAAKLRELPGDTIIITTEKDGIKLTNSKKVPREIQERLYVLPIKLRFTEGDEDKFIKALQRDVKEN